MAPKRSRAGQGSGRAAKTAKGGEKPSGDEAVADIEDFKFEPAEVAQIRSSLLDWYDRNHRILPWRRNPHSKLAAATVAAAAAEGSLPAPADLPQNDFVYYVYVCEIMSQQTQVSRAADYFRRWVARWPTVAALAAASQEEVNEAWAGLGYYRRARYLLEGARHVVEKLDGSFPTTAKELLSIPGIGAYTSAAIASIACGERSAVVDGNVIRVLARLRRVAGDPRSGPLTKLWAQLADALLDPDRPGDFNQAVMELGATVCVPNAEPKCGECPIASCCAVQRAVRRHAEAGGQPGEAGAPRPSDYPTKVEKAEKREEAVAVAVVRLLPPGAAAPAGASGREPPGSRFLLVQRPPTGLLAGLWQFPLLPLQPGVGEESAAAQQALMDGYLQEQLGVQLLPARGEPGGAQQEEHTPADGPGVLHVVERRPLGSLVHVFSHIRMSMRVEALTLQGEISVSPRAGDERQGLAALQWVPAAEMQGKGLSSGVKKVYKLFADARAKAGSKQSITAFFKPRAAPAAGDDGASS